MAEELFDVVDADDRVVGVAPRSEVHARNLLHRAVHIFVRNSRGELLIHRRSDTKDQYPDCFTSSASGHLEAGEDYESAAARELREELGLTAPLTFLVKFPGGPDMAYEHSALYEVVTDTPPQFDPEEIASGEFLELPVIAALVSLSPEEFTPCFRTLFQWYLTHRNAAQPPSSC